jgi:putative flippase GtrA
MLLDVLYYLLGLKPVRYFFSAGIATVVDVLVYYLVYNHLLHQTELRVLDSMVFRAPTVALTCSYSCGLVTNFSITKYFVFHESELSGRIQLFRFILVAMVVLVANYFFMYFLINVLGWYPTLSRAVSAITIGVFSFVAHRVFSFKI